MQGVQNLPPPVLKQIHGEAFRQIASLALSDRDADRTVNQTADGVLEISSKDGESVRIHGGREDRASREARLSAVAR